VSVACCYADELTCATGDIIINDVKPTDVSYKMFPTTVNGRVDIAQFAPKTAADITLLPNVTEVVFRC
jgi:hypothetical protein